MFVYLVILIDFISLGYRSSPILSLGASAVSGIRDEVRQIAVGPSHFALLFKDGRLARLPFSVISDRLDLSKNAGKSTVKAGGGGGGGGAGGGGGSGGSGGGSGGGGGAGTATAPATGGASGGSRPATTTTTRTRGRIIRTSTIRGRGGVILSSSRQAPVVPEELIAQAQSVLQGRSRNLIIRELQRTNLDVNLAVNNLLSRDEEGDDDADDSQGDYVPEDLISLLDAGISADHPSVIIDADAMFNEDMFGYSQARGRSSSSNRRSSERSTERERSSAVGEPGGADRDNIFRWRDRQYFGPKRWLETALRDPAWQEGEKDGGKKDSGPQAGPSPLWLGDELEFWPERQVGVDIDLLLHIFI